MKIEFDQNKSDANTLIRGLPFDLVIGFDFDSAQIVEDARRDYGEVRYRAVGKMDGVQAVVVFTLRGDAVRVISLRLAGRKERQKYEEAQDQSGNPE
jgi:uncharacterized DUF497 family protein